MVHDTPFTLFKTFPSILVFLLVCSTLADIPVHCEIKDIIGIWEIFFGPILKTGSDRFGIVDSSYGNHSSVDENRDDGRLPLNASSFATHPYCNISPGESAPSMLLRQFSGKQLSTIINWPSKEFVHLFPSKVTPLTAIDHRFFPGLLAVSLSKGHGTWTMIYDEGFEVRLGGRSLFAFNRWECVDKDNPACYIDSEAHESPDGSLTGFTPICNETMVGWYHQELHMKNQSLTPSKEKIGSVNKNEREGYTLKKEWTDRFEYGCWYGRKVHETNPRIPKAGYEEFETPSQDGKVLEPDNHRFPKHEIGHMTTDQALLLERKHSIRRVDKINQKNDSMAHYASWLLDSGIVSSKESPIHIAPHIQKEQETHINPHNLENGRIGNGNKTTVSTAPKKNYNSTEVDGNTVPILSPVTLTSCNTDRGIEEESMNVSPLPLYFDWRDQLDGIWNVPILIQGDCGSCYAVAAVYSFQSRINILLQKEKKRREYNEDKRNESTKIHNLENRKESDFPTKKKDPLREQILHMKNILKKNVGTRSIKDLDEKNEGKNERLESNTNINIQNTLLDENNNNNNKNKTKYKNSDLHDPWNDINLPIKLSVASSLACNWYNQACNGGLEMLVHRHTQEMGIPEEKCFPYADYVPTGYSASLLERHGIKLSDETSGSVMNISDNTLHTPSSYYQEGYSHVQCKGECYEDANNLWFVSDYGYVGGNYGSCSETRIQREIYDNGPITVGVNVVGNQNRNYDIVDSSSSVNGHTLSTSSIEYRKHYMHIDKEKDVIEIRLIIEDTMVTKKARHNNSKLIGKQKQKEKEVNLLNRDELLNRLEKVLTDKEFSRYLRNGPNGETRPIYPHDQKFISFFISSSQLTDWKAFSSSLYDKFEIHGLRGLKIFDALDINIHGWEYVDHAISILGWGVDHELVEGKEIERPYWIVRNSWSPSTPGGGYIKLRRGTDAFGLESAAVWVDPDKCRGKLGILLDHSGC